MSQAILKPLTFEEFIAWYPTDGRYELIDGIVTEMQPTGEHEAVTEFIATSFTLEVNRLQLPYKFPDGRSSRPQVGIQAICLMFWSSIDSLC
jgi:Uma2 family endonuclease